MTERRKDNERESNFDRLEIPDQEIGGTFRQMCQFSMLICLTRSIACLVQYSDAPRI